jgi:hypothetical protein
MLPAREIPVLWSGARGGRRKEREGRREGGKEDGEAEACSELALLCPRGRGAATAKGQRLTILAARR